MSNKTETMKAICVETTVNCLAAMSLPNISAAQIEQLSLSYAAARAAMKSLRITAQSILKEHTK